MRSLCLAIPLLAACAAIAGELPPQTPLLVNGSTAVTALDFEAGMLRVPEEKRGEVRTDPKAIASMVDILFINRMLAAKARAAGLDKDPIIVRRLAQLEEGVLAEQYLKKVEREAPIPDLEGRARELYMTDPKRFEVGEQVYVQQILVSLKGRTREMALERVNELYKEVAANKESFLSIARRVSEDPERARNGGDLGWHGISSFVAPIAQAIGQMKTKGEIAGPVETQFGFHILRFVDRKPAVIPPFESVKKGLIAEERDKLLAAARQNAMEEVQGDKNNVVYMQNIDALKIEVDAAKLSRKGAPVRDAKP